MQRSIYTIGWLFVLMFFLAPIVYLASLPSLAHFTKIFNSENTLKALINTILVAGSVSILCILISVPIAWVLTRTDLPLKNKFRTWFCLPYAIPPYVGAIGWIILANPSSGLLNNVLGLHLNIYSFFGLVWVETSFLFTFVLLNALTALDHMDSSLEEAARLSGASGIQVFKDISLPLLKPAMLSGFILTFLATAASFGVPALIGGPARIYLMTTQIYTYQRMGTAEGLQLAIGVSVLLMLATFVLQYFVQKRLSKNKTYMVGGKTARASIIPLGPKKIPVIFVLTMLLGLIFVIPLAGVAISAFSEVQGSWSFAGLGLQNFKRVLFETGETPRAILQSLGLGLAAATFCTLVSFILGYFTTKTKFRGSPILSTIVALPFSTPGTVLALALILSFSQGYFGMGPSLYNTLGLIFLAYVVKYMSLGLKTVQDGYGQIHPSLEEAAQLSGASWWAVMGTIYWPLLKSSLMAAAFFVFMPVVGELTMTILLTGPGLETVGTLIFQLQEYSDVGGGGAAVLSLLIVAIVFSLNFSLRKLSKGQYGL